MKRVWNFNAGPSPMPLPVLEGIREEWTDFRGTGMSIIEMSHRSAEFQALLAETKALLTELLELKDGQEIVFIQGGGTMQFLMEACNFLHTCAAYADTGVWAHKARDAAKFFGEAYDANTAKDKNYTYIPDTYDIRPGTDYLHITTNNTIYGTEYWKFPEVDVPVICDMSSDILSRRVDCNQFAMIWAGIQKISAPPAWRLPSSGRNSLKRPAQTCRNFSSTAPSSPRIPPTIRRRCSASTR